MEKETLLYKYFEGSLSPEEELLFERFLEEDDDFREQFELEKNVQEVVRDSERSAQKKKLQQFELEFSKAGSSKTTFWKPMRIAASIAILLGASWFIFNSAIFNSPNDLYASNYEKYPNTAYTITRGDTKDNSLERQAFEAYELNDYDMAIHYFKELRNKTGLDYVDFYLGQSYLANGDTEKAIDAFEKISSINSDYQSEALWYAAIAHLKLGQNKRAMSLLETLLEDGSYKFESAKTLLENLK